MIKGSSWDWMIYYVLLRCNKGWEMKGIREDGEWRCSDTCVTGDLGYWTNSSPVLQGCRSAHAFMPGDILHTQTQIRGHLQQWHWRSSTKVTAWRRRDPQALTRASPSSPGWSTELSHLRMGFNAVPIRGGFAQLVWGTAEAELSQRWGGELLELQRKCFLAQV